jgi:iron complex transport system substrate-binding protein
MNAKNLVLVGIAVCAILLTSPVLASAGYSKIYGNANEDDVLDMRDVTYIKLVIFGKKPATTLADANNDGKISMLDVGQTKLIILGKEKEITIVDMADRTVTVPRPIERVVTLMPPITRVVIGLGEADKLVGIGTWSHGYIPKSPAEAIGRGLGPKWNEVVAGLHELPDVGTGWEPSKELIVSLKPDVIIPYVSSPDLADTLQESTGIPVVVAYGGGGGISGMFEQIELIAKVLEKDEEAEDIISYFKEELDKVTEVTSEIPDSERPRVYAVSGARGVSEITKTCSYEPIDLAGGINVAEDYVIGSGSTVSKEQVILWNPDIILILDSQGCIPPIAVTMDDVLSDPDLQTVNAVKNQRVYLTPGAFFLVGADHPRVILETHMMAKYIHPGKFEDLDLEKEGNELFERFYGVDGLWTEIGGNLGFI